MEDKEIVHYLQHLSKVYEALNGEPLIISICGGAALNLLGYVRRVTKDIDLVYPETLPETFKEAAKITAENFGLSPDWINQGPIDLLKMGLPEGFNARSTKLHYCPTLTICVASRLDQIHFKLYAAIDVGGYHLQDLIALAPTDDELKLAVRWCFTHDVSDEFKHITKDFMERNGWKNVAIDIYK